MPIQLSYLGCDVAKRHLDVYDLSARRGFRVSNDAAGIAAFTACLPGRQAFVVLEATGSYDRSLRFAEASGQSAKTDPLDAKVLAEYGARFSPAPASPCAVTERLQRLHKRRDQLARRHAGQGTLPAEGGGG